MVSSKNARRNLTKKWNRIEPKKKNEIDEKAADIIRETFRIFYFRLKTQEPIAVYKWIEKGEEFNSDQMTSRGDENEDATVEICEFPLIYRNTDPLQIYTRAKVFISDSCSSSNLTEENSKSNLFSNLINNFNNFAKSKNPS